MAGGVWRVTHGQCAKWRADIHAKNQAVCDLVVFRQDRPITAARSRILILKVMK